MPLYTFKCLECEHEMEHFFHSLDDSLEVVCDECGRDKCERQVSLFGSRVRLSAKDHYNQKIKPDAERMLKNMSEGKDKDFLSVYGEN